jgi:phosphatidate phosphatase PAH1
MSTNVSKRDRESGVKNSVFSFGDSRHNRLSKSPLKRTLQLSNKKKWGGQNFQVFSSGNNELNLKLRTNSAFRVNDPNETKKYARVKTQDFAQIISREMSMEKSKVERAVDESEIILEDDDSGESTPSEKIESMKNSSQDHLFDKINELRS